MTVGEAMYHYVCSRLMGLTNERRSVCITGNTDLVVGHSGQDVLQLKPLEYNTVTASDDLANCICSIVGQTLSLTCPSRDCPTLGAQSSPATFGAAFGKSRLILNLKPDLNLSFRSAIQ